VSDGDTITVLDGTKTQHKIRLAGIDAPESKQAFGQASKKHMSALVFNRDVTLDCDKTDKYGREVCIVLVDGQDANLAQVRAGMAWWYRERAISGATVVLRGRRGCGEGWARGAMEGY
jgi:endonuclease YncB( thermonuclease family)